MRGIDQVSARHNNSLLNAVCLASDDVGHGVARIVCKQGHLSIAASALKCFQETSH